MTSRSPGIGRRYTNLDILRVALALEVVAFHTSPIWHKGFVMPVDAVTAFICLSGFLIPGSFQSSRDVGHFVWKRFLRVVPALVLSFALLATLLGPQQIFPALVYYLTAGTVAVISLNGALWSLAVEEVLYAQHALSRIVKLPWCPGVVAALLIICLLCGWAIRTSDNVRIAWAAAGFFAGNLAYFAKSWLGRVHWAYYGVAVGLLVWQPQLDGLFGIVLLPLMVVLLAYTLPQPQLGIPDLSYGIYVYHLPFLHFWGRMLGSHLLSIVILTFGGAIVTAALSWYLVESQFLKLKDQTPRSILYGLVGARSPEGVSSSITTASEG